MPKMLLMPSMHVELVLVSGKKKMLMEKQVVYMIGLVWLVTKRRRFLLINLPAQFPNFLDERFSGTISQIWQVQ